MKKDLWKERLLTAVRFIANPRLILCFGLAWLITNGWSYVMLALGYIFEIHWMIAVAGGYLAFLWLPISPEKLVTVAISIFLLRVLFPNDEKTLGILKEWHEKGKEKWHELRTGRKKKKERKEKRKQQQKNAEEE